MKNFLFKCFRSSSQPGVRVSYADFTMLSTPYPERERNQQRINASSASSSDGTSATLRISELESLVEDLRVRISVLECHMK